MCEDCFNDAMNFGFFAVYSLAISITTALFLAFGELWPNSAPMTPKTAIIVFAMMTLICVITAGIAIECACHGILAVAEGDDIHGHVIDMLRWYGYALRHRVTNWLAYSLGLARLRAWYLRRVLLRD